MEEPPVEILVAIASYLPPRDLCACASVCTAFRDACADRTVWKRLCREHFHHEEGSIDAYRRLDAPERPWTSAKRHASNLLNHLKQWIARAGRAAIVTHGAAVAMIAVAHVGHPAAKAIVGSNLMHSKYWPATQAGHTLRVGIFAFCGALILCEVVHEVLWRAGSYVLVPLMPGLSSHHTTVALMTLCVSFSLFSLGCLVRTAVKGTVRFYGNWRNDVAARRRRLLEPVVV